MAGSLVSFPTEQYEKHEISSFIYEPVWNEDGSLKDFRVVYASDIFARDWLAIYHNEDYLGAGIRNSTLMDEYSLQMMECSVAEAKELMTGIGFFKTTNADDRPLVRSMLERRVAYDGSSILTIQKITAKRNKIWCNVHYGFIDDFGDIVPTRM